MIATPVSPRSQVKEALLESIRRQDVGTPPRAGTPAGRRIRRQPLDHDQGARRTRQGRLPLPPDRQRNLHHAARQRNRLDPPSGPGARRTPHRLARLLLVLSVGTAAHPGNRGDARKSAGGQYENPPGIGFRLALRTGRQLPESTRHHRERRTADAQIRAEAARRNRSAGRHRRRARQHQALPEHPHGQQQSLSIRLPEDEDRCRRDTPGSASFRTTRRRSPSRSASAA